MKNERKAAAINNGKPAIKFFTNYSHFTPSGDKTQPFYCEVSGGQR